MKSWLEDWMVAEADDSELLVEGEQRLYRRSTVDRLWCNVTVPSATLGINYFNKAPSRPKCLLQS